MAQLLVRGAHLLGGSGLESDPTRATVLAHPIIVERRQFRDVRHHARVPKDLPDTQAHHP